MNEQMLDELIAMSTNELMNDLGLQPSCSKKSARASTNPKREPEDAASSTFRRRATSSDTVSAQKSIRQLAKLKQRKSDQTEVKKEDHGEEMPTMRSSSSDAKLRMAKDAKRRSK
jgi:hypothetical protein